MAVRDAVVNLIANPAGFKAGMDAAAAEADLAGTKFGNSMDSASNKVGGIFTKLGNSMNGFGIPFGNAVSDIGKKFDETSTKGEKFGQALSTLGGTTLAGVAVGLAGVSAVSVKMAGDFQTAMTQLVTGAGESEKNIKAVGAGILAMAGQVGQTPIELAKGMYLIESAGYHGAAGLDVLKASAEGAATGNAQMETVANAVTTALHDYAIPADHANQVTSALIETVAQGKVHLEDLAAAMGRVMPQASALGISFQDTNGALATMTNSGLSAQRAGMRLANMLLALSAPSSAATKAMASVGLTSQQVKDTIDGPGGLTAGLQLIEQHVGKTFPANSVESVNALKTIMGGATGFSVALMLGGKNAADFADKSKAIGTVLNGSGTQVQGFNKVQGDLNFQLDQARATAESLAISFGQFLIPKLEDVMRAVSATVLWFEKHKDAAIALAAVIGGVLTAAITVFTVNTISNMIQATQKALTTLGLMGSASDAEGTATNALTAELEAQNAVLAESSTYFAAVTAAEQLNASVTATLETSATTLAEGETVLSEAAATAATNVGLLAESMSVLEGNMATADGAMATFDGSLTTLDGVATTSATEVTAVGSAAEITAGKMGTASAAAGTEGMAGGLTAAEGASVGLAGVLGPLALGLGAAEVAGFALNKVIGNTSVNMQDAIDKSMNLKENTLPQLSNAYNVLTQALKEQTTFLQSMGLTQQEVSADTENYRQRIQDVQNQILMYEGNLQTLQSGLGLTQTQVLNLANATGTNLKNALSGGEVADMAAQMYNLGYKTLATGTDANTAAGQVAQAFNTMTGSFSSLAATAGTDATQIGTSIAGGVYSGIIAGIPQVINAADALSQAAVTAAHHAINNPPFPSQVFRDEIGLSIAAGIAAGITDGSPGVNAAVHAAITGAATGSVGSIASVTPSPVAGTAANNAVGGGQIVVQTTLNIDGQQFLQAIQPAAALYQRTVPLPVFGVSNVT